jgi:hypothetical protein
MPELGKKYTCYSCHTKFYDLGKAVPTCPKCGADQRDSEEKPVVTSHRGRRVAVVEEPAEEPEFAEPEAAPNGGADEDEEIVPETPEREEPEEDEEEEY